MVNCPNRVSHSRRRWIQRQAVLLDAYVTAIHADPHARPPQGLDPDLAQVAIMIDRLARSLHAAYEPLDAGNVFQPPSD